MQASAPASRPKDGVVVVVVVGGGAVDNGDANVPKFEFAKNPGQTRKIAGEKKTRFWSERSPPKNFLTDFEFVVQSS